MVTLSFAGIGAGQAAESIKQTLHDEEDIRYHLEEAGVAATIIAIVHHADGRSVSPSPSPVLYKCPHGSIPAEYPPRDFRSCKCMPAYSRNDHTSTCDLENGQYQCPHLSYESSWPVYDFSSCTCHEAAARNEGTKTCDLALFVCPLGTTATEWPPHDFDSCKCPLGLEWDPVESLCHHSWTASAGPSPSSTPYPTGSITPPRRESITPRPTKSTAPSLPDSSEFPLPHATISSSPAATPYSCPPNSRAWTPAPSSIVDCICDPYFIPLLSENRCVHTSHVYSVSPPPGP